MKTEAELPEYIKQFTEKDSMGATMGARCVSLSLSECIYEYEVSEKHFNPNGILHGGALYCVMDSAQGMLVHAILDEQFKAAATGTSVIKYLAPVARGKVKIVTTLKEKQGRKLFVTSKAYDENGTPVCELEEIWIALFK
ncbi:MAG: PaaI family thioesterase [Pseudobdellovibrio sp.]|jgi:uncharacterized protein (TIGR00369 family)|nr:PaaI family thioesterase [Pseudobdellovibrio sp.]